jgi:hypothetical protein
MSTDKAGLKVGVTVRTVILKVLLVSPVKKFDPPPA